MTATVLPLAFTCMAYAVGWLLARWFETSSVRLP